MFALFVCVLPRRTHAHTRTHTFTSVFYIWIKYSLAVHLHCCNRKGDKTFPAAATAQAQTGPQALYVAFYRP